MNRSSLFRALLPSLLLVPMLFCSPEVAHADQSSHINAYQLTPPAPKGWDDVSWRVYVSDGGWEISIRFWSLSMPSPQPGSQGNPYSSNLWSGSSPIQNELNYHSAAFVEFNLSVTGVSYLYHIHNVKGSGDTEDYDTPTLTWYAGSGY